MARFVLVQPLSPVSSGRWRLPDRDSSSHCSLQCKPQSTEPARGWGEEMLPQHSNGRAELGLQGAAETTGASTRGIQGFQTQMSNLAPQARTPAQCGRTRSSTTGMFLISENLWGLQALGVGGKTTVALLAPASLHPPAGEGWRAGTVAKLVFLSSHRPKISAGLNAGFFSNHFLLISCIKASHHLFTAEQDSNAEQNCQVIHLTSRV